jgi:TolB-like protein
MASIIPGYEYDIFISYRQKDNKGDRWVSEFVEALKTELESTFKEEISVYFDINPHDGLLETHDVEASLKDKLKCLVFIPIISRTYCDPKSFAWEHEFKAFVEQASQDQFGLKVKLTKGNVASRVLPIRIHDLDSVDFKECESVLGGFLRGVEFIYKSIGVNRPLRSNEDRPLDNLNKTTYRDQINKASLAIREIISGLNGVPIENRIEQEKVVSTIEKPTLKEKSIIVLPFENISPDPDQEYFSDGLTEEIITDLSHIHDLLVISRSSAMTFKGVRKKIKDIAREVNVHYVLEGSVRKSGNKLRITAQLIDAKSDTHLWAEKYSGTLDNIFDMQEKVSRSIVSALSLKLTVSQERKITKRSIDNFQAYDFYLRARNAYLRFTKDGLDESLQLLEKGREIIGDNALLLASLGWTHEEYVRLGFSQGNDLMKAEEYGLMALDLDKDTTLAYIVLGLVHFLRGDSKMFSVYLKKALLLDPNDILTIQWISWSYILIGKTEEALPLANRILNIDPLNPVRYILGVVYFYQGQFERAVEIFKTFIHQFPWAKWWYAYYLVYLNRNEEAINIIATIEQKLAPAHLLLCSILKHILHKEYNQIPHLLTDQIVSTMRMDAIASCWVATLYAMIDDKENTLDWLENSVNRGLINFPYLFQYDPFLAKLHDHPRFMNLKERVKNEWENFEV